MPRSLGPTLLCICSLALPVAGHHSVAFYSSETVEVAGEIAQIRWQNPHIQFDLPATVKIEWLAYGDTIRRYDCQKQ